MERFKGHPIGQRERAVLGRAMELHRLLLQSSVVQAD